MGYTTEFEGKFTVTPPLSSAHREYLAKFNETRRMRRLAELTAGRPDPLREAAGLAVGVDGGFFVGADAPFGQEWKAADVVDTNRPPIDQPGLWCKWRPSDDGAAIVWDEGEKFYDYVEWLQYLIDNFLRPWGYALDGVVTWGGEDRNDVGVIRCEASVIGVTRGHAAVAAAKR